MPEEPGGWELRRALTEHRNDMREGFKTLNERLDQMVTRGEHQADQRRMEDALKALADDLAVERQTRAEAIALEREQRTIEINAEVRARKEDAEAWKSALHEAVDTWKESQNRMVTWLRWCVGAMLTVAGLVVTLYVGSR